MILIPLALLVNMLNEPYGNLGEVELADHRITDYVHEVSKRRASGSACGDKPSLNVMLRDLILALE